MTRPAFTLLLFVFGVHLAHAQGSDPAAVRAQMFGQNVWIDNAGLRPIALPDDQISTAGTDVFESIETTRDVFTFSPLRVRFPTKFENCRLALVSNRNLTGIRSAYLCDPPQTLGYLNFIATREDAPTLEAFRSFADRNRHSEAQRLFGVGQDQGGCQVRPPSGGFKDALVCEFQFAHAGRPAVYRKILAWSDGVIISATTACAGPQCDTALPALENFVATLSIAR
jgi:hypothetical protein